MIDYNKIGFTGNPADEGDVYQFLLEGDQRGHLKNRNAFKLYFPDLYNKIISGNLNTTWSFAQVLYHYFNPHPRTTCLTCGKPTKFTTFKKGYQEYCNAKCCNTNSDKINRTIQGNLDRYGVENVSQIPEVVEKIKQTQIDKYGSYYNQTQECRDKIMQTCIDRYGVPFTFQKDDFWEKAKATSREKYGTDYPSQSDTVKSKIKNTYYNRTSYTNPSYNPDVIEKRKITNYAKYDGKWFTETDEIKECNHNRFLLTHPDIIGETLDAYIVKCDDECKLCGVDKKCFTIDKQLYRTRRIQQKIPGSPICPIRHPKRSISSYIEQTFVDFIRSVYTGPILVNDRTIIPPRELDVVLPEKKIAFEFNGVFWHSDYNTKMTKQYHKDKSQKCMEAGYQLIHVWEDDWTIKHDIVKDFIMSKLCRASRIIYARKCTVKTIPAKEARVFFETNHLQGYANATYKLGLYYNDELVCAMLLGQLRRTMGSTPIDGHYEIYRFVTKLSTEVIGGFSKILRYFEREYNPIEIITYGDLCYTTGHVYLKNGFIKTCISEPCYSWNVNGVRRHRSNFMKRKLHECIDNPALTEDEVMRSRGAFKVWDAGKIKFTKSYNITSINDIS